MKCRYGEVKFLTQIESDAARNIQASRKWFFIIGFAAGLMTAIGLARYLDKAASLPPSRLHSLLTEES